MKVKALIEFFDLKESVLREIGDVFDVSEERFKEILVNGGEWLEEIEGSEDTPPETEEPEGDVSTETEEPGGDGNGEEATKGKAAAKGPRGK
ncbi:MAG: hypothetical protein GXZ11_05670 [Tissierellia bacterium]|nr:hypothetical protein [Tissierellia bacterium]